jgi:hypothetical protein
MVKGGGETMPRFRIRTLMLLVACVAIAGSLFCWPGAVGDRSTRRDVDLSIGFETWIGIATVSAVVWLLCRWSAPSDTEPHRSRPG